MTPSSFWFYSGLKLINGEINLSAANNSESDIFAGGLELQGGKLNLGTGRRNLNLFNGKISLGTKSGSSDILPGNYTNKVIVTGL